MSNKPTRREVAEAAACHLTGRVLESYRKASAQMDKLNDDEERGHA